MSNTRVTQGHKVAIAAGGAVPARITQAHKIVLLTIGSVPSRVTQGHLVVLLQPSLVQPGSIRVGSTLIQRIFKGTVPVNRVYAGEAWTFQSP